MIPRTTAPDTSGHVMPPVPTDPSAITAAVTALSEALLDIDAAHRRIRHRLARVHGFSTAEITALHIVGSDADCTPKHLAHELDLSTGAITSMVDRLERAGQMERMPHPSDRRSQLLTLTFRGEETLGQVMDLYNSAVADVVKNSPCVFDLGMIDCLQHAATAINTAASRDTDTTEDETAA